jgi:hypothetical protein
VHSLSFLTRASFEAANASSTTMGVVGTNAAVSANNCRGRSGSAQPTMVSVGKKAAGGFTPLMRPQEQQRGWEAFVGMCVALTGLSYWSYCQAVADVRQEGQQQVGNSSSTVSNVC